MHEALDGELDRRGAVIAALDSCPDADIDLYLLPPPTICSSPTASWRRRHPDEYNETSTDLLWGFGLRSLFGASSARAARCTCFCSWWARWWTRRTA